MREARVTNQPSRAGKQSSFAAESNTSRRKRGRAGGARQCDVWLRMQFLILILFSLRRARTAERPSGF